MPCSVLVAHFIGKQDECRPGLKKRVWGVQVPKQMRASFLEAVADGRIRSMQNKLMPAAPIHRPGALLLGDAFNMRHPLTGQAAPFSDATSHPPSYECQQC